MGQSGCGWPLGAADHELVQDVHGIAAVLAAVSSFFRFATAAISRARSARLPSGRSVSLGVSRPAPDGRHVGWIRT
jgi:hypothetical protein